MSDALFDLPPIEPPPVLSAGQKLTIRNNTMIANGCHPVTRCALANNGQTCATCAHHVVRRRNQVWHKCDLSYSHGAGTDIRISWPACIKWEAKP